MNDNHQEKVVLAHSSAQSLLSIINDILDFSRIDAGKMSIEVVEFDLLTLLREIVDIIAVSVKEKGLYIKLDTVGIENAAVKGDPSRLRQILNNLIGNAVKFTDAGEITVRACLQPADDLSCVFRCSVKDTGIGIPATEHARLFEPFHQVDSTTTRLYGGSGLGLSIVKQLCELMGGDINVSTPSTGGSCFTFSVILQSGIQTANETINAPENNTLLNSAELPGWPEKARILIVEDNSVNQDVLRFMLEGLGLKYDIAFNGKEALEQLDLVGENRYSVVLMDCQMPEMDGYTATRKIRLDACKGYKNIPIIALTANAMAGDREKCLESGMNDYLSKPIVVVDLERMLRKWST